MPNSHDNVPSPVQQPPRPLRSYGWSAISGASIGGRVGKIFTAETAEGAEMTGVSDHLEQSLRSLR